MQKAKCIKQKAVRRPVDTNSQFLIPQSPLTNLQPINSIRHEGTKAQRSTKKIPTMDTNSQFPIPNSMFPAYQPLNSFRFLNVNHIRHISNEGVSSVPYMSYVVQKNNSPNSKFHASLLSTFQRINQSTPNTPHKYPEFFTTFA